MAAPKNPKGAKSDKLWRDALMRAVKRRAAGKDSPHELDEIATTCVKAAINGESWAVKEIGDRLDGRPSQTIAGDRDKPNEVVIRIINPTKPAWIPYWHLTADQEQ